MNGPADTGPWLSGPQRRFTLLVNPSAGNGQAHRHAGIVERRLRQAGVSVEVWAADSAEQLSAWADEAVASAGADRAAGRPHVVVAVGGDGTVHLVLQAIGSTGVPMGVVAAGSGDDAARAWGLPRDEPDASADVLLHGLPGRVDLVGARCRGMTPVWFATVLATGFDARVSERALGLRSVPARIRYVAALLAELRSFQPLTYELTLDDQHVQVEAMLVAVANSASYGGGMRICPDAEPDDGLLDVLVLETVPTAELLRVFPRVYRGTHTSHPAVSVRRVRAVTVDAPGIVAFADGEPVAPLPLTARSHPQGLVVIGAGTR